MRLQFRRVNVDLLRRKERQDTPRRHVLLVDLDGQASASLWCGVGLVERLGV